MEKTSMKAIIKRLGFLIVLLLLGTLNTEAQGPCGPTVPSFSINLTGSPAGVWTSSNVARNGQCCSAVSPDQCVYFDLTLDPNAAGIQIDMVGADPAGSLFYSIGCAGSYPGGTIKCITGVGPHQITFCKPGSNKNVYIITSISKPLFPKDDTVRLGCKQKLITLGIVNNSVTWQSIFPGTPGQYNSYLDSTNIASPTYSPGAGAPPYVDYKVCGFPIASQCGYSLTVCDTIRIYNFGALSGSITPSPATFCNIGVGSGVTVNAGVSGGQAPYSFVWKNSSNAVVGTNASYFASAAGIYNVEIKDALYNSSTCPSIFKTVSVSEGTVPVVDAGPSQKVCYANPLASLSGTVQYASSGIWSGGTGTFTPGNNFLNTSYMPSPAELAAGFVKLYLASSGAGGGCVNTIDSTIIYYPSPLNVTIPPTGLGCNSSTTIVSALVSGGTPPYSYQWSTNATTNTISVGQGNFSILVQDSLGCSGTNNISLVAPVSLGIAFTVTNVTVNGGNDGSAAVTITGGTPGYSVMWSPGAQTSFTTNNLSYGVYTVTVTDANGCKISGSTVVNEPRCLGFSAASSATNVSCNSYSNGVASVTVTGGTPAYTYTWNTIPVQTTPTATNLKAGVYTLLIEDANLCFQVANVVITEPTMLTDVMTQTNVITIGGNNGAASVNVFGGTSPYAYLWNNGATTSSINNLFAGTYTVTITDNKGCTRIDSVKITEPPCSNLTFNVLSNNVLCNGGTNGTALAVVGGATGSYTISWSNGSFGPIVTGLGAGNYSVTILDSKNCYDYRNFTITQPSNLSVGLMPTGVKCNGMSDGTIDLTVSGGTYPYTFSWNNGSTAEDLAYLSPGNYSVNILDANGCSVVASAGITEPSALATSYSVQNVTCIYGTNGSIDLNVNGGVLPYTYTWSTGATTQDITNVSAGGYTVTLKDANNCAITAPLIIALPQPDSVKVDSFIVACPVPGSGVTQVSVIPAGGFSGVYQVSFDNGNTFQPTGNYSTFLPNAATYSVIVKDGNNCSSLVSDILTIYAETKIDSTVFAKCFAGGTSTVPVFVYVSGGDGGPYSVSYTGVSFQAAGTYSFNLNTGTSYSFVARDTRACVSAPDAITIPAAFVSSVAVTSDYNGQHISCNGLTDGSASVTATGGTAGYSYSWTTIPTQTTATASSLGAGTYTVILMDVNNCITTNTITLIEPSQLTSTASITSNYNGQDVSCYGLNDGSASVAQLGGTGPYSYAWSTVPIQNTANASNLSAGTYTAVVMDANNCSTSSTILVSQPVAINGTVSITSNYNGQHVSCNGLSDGQASANVIGGTGVYTYSWSTNPVQTTSVASGLGAGTYSVAITDVNGCQAIYLTSLSQPLPVTATTQVTSNYNGADISCYGLSNASASVTNAGGTAPYVYGWSTTPSQTLSTATNLSAGTYTIMVTDMNGCAITTSVIVSQPNPLISSVSNLSNFNGYGVSCFGSANGFIDVNVNGGTGAYSYIWSSASTTQDVMNLAAGSYSMVVTDINGCTDTLETIITQPFQLIVSIDSVLQYNGYNVRCFGSKDGGVFVSVSGGVAAYAYVWNSGATVQDLTNTGSGQYILNVTDLNGCSVSLDTTLTQPAALTFSSAVNEPLCNGVANGSVNVAVSGGVNPFTYSWSNGVNTEDLNNIAAGTYSVIYTDKNGCADTAIVNVNQPQVMVLYKEVAGLKCYSDTMGAIALTISGGTTPYSYQWSNSSIVKDQSNLPVGIYAVQVTDANGCLLNDTTVLTQPDSLYISLYSPLQFDGHNISFPAGNDGSIDLTVFGGTTPYNFLWSNSDKNEDQFNVPAGNYNVTVIDGNGCRVAGSIVLTEPLLLEMPSGFSPNNDGKNDKFVVHGIEAYPQNNLTIYNRWGNIVYVKDGYNNEWDGVSNNGMNLPASTYFVLLEINGGEKVLKGYVELRR